MINLFGFLIMLGTLNSNINNIKFVTYSTTTFANIPVSDLTDLGATLSTHLGSYVGTFTILVKVGSGANYFVNGYKHAVDHLNYIATRYSTVSEFWVGYYYKSGSSVTNWAKKATLT